MNYAVPFRPADLHAAAADEAPGAEAEAAGACICARPLCCRPAALIHTQETPFPST